MVFTSLPQQTQYAIVKALFDVFIYTAVVIFNIVFMNMLLTIAHRATRSIPKPRKDEFINTYGYSFDYVFVFKVYLEDEIESLSAFQKKYTMKNIIDRCQNAKIETKCFYSCQRDEIYVKMRVSISRLQAEADRIDYKLLLNPTSLRKAALAGSLDVLPCGRKVWTGIELTDETKVTAYEPYQFIYAKYDCAERLQGLYQTYPSQLDPSIVHQFRSIDRVKLLLSIFEANVNESVPGCGLELGSLLHEHVVLAHFPLHSYSELYALQKKCLVFFAPPSALPISEIRDYFGERIGLYFLFLQHFASSLWLPAALGLVVFAVRIYYGVTGYFLMPVFAAYITLWCSYFVEFWKGVQGTTAMEWGVTGFEEQEHDRLQFVGEETTSPVTGAPMLYYSPDNQVATALLSAGVVVLFVFLAIGVVGAVAYLQFRLNRDGYADLFSYAGKNLTAYISAVALAFTIQVLSKCFRLAAIWLNDFENHRTDTQYEDNLVTKLFVFQLVNSYAYLTFLSFVKPFLEDVRCVDDDCYTEISDTLLVLYVFPVLIVAIKEVFVRKWRQSNKLARETSGLEPGCAIGVVESQYILDEYRSLEVTLKNYSELVQLYGYVCLFAAVFPIGPFLALIFALVKIRIDSWKLCQAFRRPVPKTAEDIGVWQSVMDVMGVVAVIFNFALVFFTGRYLRDVQWDMRWVTFMVVEHCAVIYKIFLAVSIDAVPEDVKLQLDRQEFLVSKVLDNVMDEADDNFEVVDRVGNMVVSVTDEDWIYPVREDERAVNKKGMMAVSLEDEDGLADSQL